MKAEITTLYDTFINELKQIESLRKEHPIRIRKRFILIIMKKCFSLLIKTLELAKKNEITLFQETEDPTLSKNFFIKLTEKLLKTLKNYDLHHNTLPDHCAENKNG